MDVGNLVALLNAKESLIGRRARKCLFHTILSREERDEGADLSADQPNRSESGLSKRSCPTKIQ